MKNLYFLFCCLLALNLSAQNAGDQVFDNDVLHEVRFEFDGGSFLSTLESNFRPFDPVDPGPYTMANVVIDGERADSVGVRLKGFTSFQGEGNKNPFKIDFNRYVSGQRLDGLRKVNLNNATADPGMQRDVICYQMLNDAGVPAPRTAFAKVFINDVYWGLYQLIEQVDKEFLQINYSNDEGNLFKNKDWNNFEYSGEDPNNYLAYQLKTNEDANDYTGLINLMSVIQNTPEEDFAEEIQRIFNVDRYLRTLTVDVATNNWDSNLQHGRNWYLYEDTQTGVFHWIPWDYNLALGGQLGGGGGGFDECFIISDFLFVTDSTTSATFHYSGFYENTDSLTYEWTFGDGNGSTEAEPIHVYDSLGQYEVCLTVDGGEDFCSDTRCYDVDLTNNVYDCGAIESGNIPTTNPQVFLRMLDWMPQCCDEWSTACQISLNDLEGWFGEGNGTDNENTGFAIDQRGNGRALIDRLLNVPDFYEQYQRHFCNLVNNTFTPTTYDALVDHNRELISDAVEEDQNFLYDYDDFLEETGEDGIKEMLRERSADLRNELADMDACPEPQALAAMDVVINEFMAVNDSLGQLRDAAGETDDWIELYNNSGTEQDLSDVYLSDNPDNKFKWQFPAGTTIPADGYLIVWCDEDGEQTGLHASFKLNRDGESVFLTNADGSTIDEVVFGEQENNISESRVPNGTGNFVVQHVTFKYSNDTSVSTPDLGDDVSVRLFPNPAGQVLNVEINGREDRYQLDLISALGRVVRTNVPLTGNSIDISQLPAGFYVARVRDEAGRSRALRFVKR